MPADIRLLVRADDAGSSWSSNMGCLHAYTDGIARSIEVMMPCSWVPHAAALFNAQPKLDIGIHLTLTSEWDAVKWRPLTRAASLVDQNGDFLPLIIPRAGDNRLSLADANWSIDEIAAEFRAQIELGVAMFHNVSHVSSHMLKHFRELHPKVGEVISELCFEFRLADDALGYGLTRINGYSKRRRDTEFRKTAFIKQLKELSPGTYIFIDHPACNSAELHATGHVGYEDVATDRAICLEVLKSSELKQCIVELEIELISYRDL